MFEKNSYEDATEKQVECTCKTGRNGITNYGQMYRCCLCYKFFHENCIGHFDHNKVYEFKCVYCKFLENNE